MTATSALKSALGRRRNSDSNHRSTNIETVLNIINPKDKLHQAKNTASRIYHHRRKYVSFTPSTKDSSEEKFKERWSGELDTETAYSDAYIARATQYIPPYSSPPTRDSRHDGGPTYSAFDIIFKNHSIGKGTTLSELAPTDDQYTRQLITENLTRSRSISALSITDRYRSKQLPALAQPPIMTVRNTDDEWKALITDVEAEMTIDRTPLPVPPLLTTPEGGKGIAYLVDHTLLKVEATPRQIDELCEEARTEGFRTVCVRLPYVARCASNLRGTSIAIACVVGFHEGTHSTASKLSEATTAINSGASELDIVINYLLLKSQEYSTIYAELAALRSIAPAPVKLKLILETSQLEEREIIAGGVLAASASLDFIKTSTGFNGRGASLSDVHLMRATALEMSRRDIGRRVDGKVVPMEVKASGGVRSLKDTVAMVQAGATRIGTSSGVWIMQEVREGQKVLVGEGREGVSRLWEDEGY